MVAKEPDELKFPFAEASLPGGIEDGEFIELESKHRNRDCIEGEGVRGEENCAGGVGCACGGALALHGHDSIHDGEGGAHAGVDVRDDLAEFMGGWRDPVVFSLFEAGNTAKEVFPSAGVGGRGVSLELGQVDHEVGVEEGLGQMVDPVWDVGRRGCDRTFAFEVLQYRALFLGDPGVAGNLKASLRRREAADGAARGIADPDFAIQRLEASHKGADKFTVGHRR